MAVPCGPSYPPIPHPLWPVPVAPGAARRSAGRGIAAGAIPRAAEGAPAAAPGSVVPRPVAQPRPRWRPHTLVGPGRSRDRTAESALPVPGPRFAGLAARRPMRDSALSCSHLPPHCSPAWRTRPWRTRPWHALEGTAGPHPATGAGPAPISAWLGARAPCGDAAADPLPRRSVRRAPPHTHKETPALFGQGLGVTPPLPRGVS